MNDDNHHEHVAANTADSSRTSLPALVNRIWRRIGSPMLSFFSPLLLAVIYFLVITPVGFMMRLMGRDSLRLKIDGSADTYWIKKSPPGPPPESMRNQF